MTTGMVMLVGGIALFIVAIIATVYFILKGKRSKEELREYLKEEY